MTEDAGADGPIRVLIVDDHGPFRDGLRALLSSARGMAVAGEAADGATAVAETLASQPDVVLMDVNMAGVDGVAATRRIASSRSPSPAHSSLATAPCPALMRRLRTNAAKATSSTYPAGPSSASGNTSMGERK